MIKSGTFYFFFTQLAGTNRSVSIIIPRQALVTSRLMRRLGTSSTNVLLLATNAKSVRLTEVLGGDFFFLFVKTYNSRWKLFKWIEILFNSSYITRFNSELFLNKMNHNCSNMILYTYTSWLYKIRSVSMQLKIGILIFISICITSK